MTDFFIVVIDGPEHEISYFWFARRPVIICESVPVIVLGDVGCTPQPDNVHVESEGISLSCQPIVHEPPLFNTTEGFFVIVTSGVDVDTVVAEQVAGSDTVDCTTPDEFLHTRFVVPASHAHVCPGGVTMPLSTEHPAVAV